MSSQTSNKLSENEINALARSLARIGQGRTAVSLGELALETRDSNTGRASLESLHTKGFGFLESRDMCAECSSDMIAGVCTKSYLHDGAVKMERFSPNNLVIKSAISSWILETLLDIGWSADRDDLAQRAQVDYVLEKDDVVATLNVHTDQLDFRSLMADVGKSKESEINAIFVVIFAFGVSSQTAATYISTHPEIILLEASVLPRLGDTIRSFDESLRERLNSINLSGHLIKKYEGTDFGPPIDQLHDSWNTVLTELPSLACQDSLMITKYGTPAKVGKAFEKNCASLIGSMLRVVRLGGKNQPDGVVVIPGQGNQKPGLLLYECKTTKDQPYVLSARDQRQILYYVRAFRSKEAREVYRNLGIVVISLEFDEKNCEEKQAQMEGLLQEGEVISFLPITTLLTLAERYVAMLPEIRMRLEYDYSGVQRLFSSGGLVDLDSVGTFLDDVRARELRIERDVRFLLR